MSALVFFCSMLLKHVHYVNRWVNAVDIALKKGKGPVLGKLRILTLIEGDLQALMRIFPCAKDCELIENDKRLAKANYRLCKNFSIETAIAEKRLIADRSLLMHKATVYNLIDLKSCYDRQLVNAGSIVEEFMQRNRRAMM